MEQKMEQKLNINGTKVDQKWIKMEQKWIKLETFRSFLCDSQIQIRHILT